MKNLNDNTDTWFRERLNHMNESVNDYSKHNKMFESFLDSLKIGDNSTLIDSVKNGYKTIFESDNVINVRGIANLVSLFENPEIPLETKTETFLAVLAKTHGYYWAGIGEANALIKRIPTSISKQLIDAVDETGELHPDRIKFFRSQIPLDLTESTLPKTFYHATYRAALRNIKKYGLGSSKSPKTYAWDNDYKSEDHVYLADDLDVAYSYAEASDNVPDEWLDNIVIFSVDSEDLDLSKIEEDPNLDVQDGTYLYKGIIPANKLTLLVSDEEYHSLNESVEDYRGEHEAPDADNGMPIYNLNGIYPEDIYSYVGAKFYGDNGGDSMDNESISVIKSVRNRPKAKVKVYRAIPDVNKGVNDKIKSLQYIIRYFNAYGFFPMNNEVVNRYTEKYYIEDEGYSLPYEEMQTTVINEINNDIEALRSELQSGIKINSGDWVTTSRQYAVEHGQGNLNNKYKIITKTVPANTLFTDGNSIHEWGYWE